MFDVPEQCEAKSLVCSDDTIRGRIFRNKRRLEEQLAIANQALEALDKNPELTKLLELVNKAR